MPYPVPLVAINCITYNQGRYIRHTLDGFIMQRTNFPYVAIIHDDASNDGTTDIIKEYAEKYPYIIKPIFETENQYSKGTLGDIMYKAIQNTGAKYVAYCEGDDYWTDPLKLQKQVGFLDSHPDYSLCFNAIEILNENTNERYPLANVETREYQPCEIIESLLLQTASVVVRRDVLDSARYQSVKADRRFTSGDYSLYLSAGAMGKFYCIADNMSIYRVSNSGVTNSMRTDPFKFVNEVKLMNEHFGDLYARSFKNNLAKGYLRTLLIGTRWMNPSVISKSIVGLIKYIWFLKPRTLKRSVYRR